MPQSTYHYNTRERRRKQRRRRRIQQIWHVLQCTAAALVLCAGILVLGKMALSNHQEPIENSGEFWQAEGQNTKTSSGKLPDLDGVSIQGLPDIPGGYPQELLELLEKNEETYEFVSNYQNREQYQGRQIELEKEIEPGQVPLLMQWDMRWGYDLYGEDMIAVAGCGPVCMSMAYLYLTGDTGMNPRKMAEFADQNGYDTEVGTSWDFFTGGASLLGLQGKEIGLGETAIKEALDKGGVIICSMRPGDFTTTGHFILIRGYDEKGFYINDPNSKKNSKKQWDFETVSPQIKCLWAIFGMS